MYIFGWLWNVKTTVAKIYRETLGHSEKQRYTDIKILPSYRPCLGRWHFNLWFHSQMCRTTLSFHHAHTHTWKLEVFLKDMPKAYREHDIGHSLSATNICILWTVLFYSPRANFWWYLVVLSMSDGFLGLVSVIATTLLWVCIVPQG